jgi:hypothetical protein
VDEWLQILKGGFRRGVLRMPQTVLSIRNGGDACDGKGHKESMVESKYHEFSFY